MDLIDRQAAIDAAKCGALSAAIVYGRTEEGSTALRETVKAIKAIPSAQPESQWISCSERLPEHRLYVLVTYKYEYGLIDNGITWYSETENKWNTSREVIAWMPLPEPYAERRTDE